MTNADRIFYAVASLVKDEGKTIFTRAEVFQNIDPEMFRWQSYDPTFQSMRVKPGKASLPRKEYQKVFEQVAHGKYRLTPKGQRLIDELN